MHLTANRNVVDNEGENSTIEGRFQKGFFVLLGGGTGGLVDTAQFHRQVGMMEIKFESIAWMVITRRQTLIHIRSP